METWQGLRLSRLALKATGMFRKGEQQVLYLRQTGPGGPEEGGRLES